MRKRGRSSHIHALGSDRITEPAGRPEVTRAQALRAVGEVVYAARVDDTIKIGYTKNLADRLRSLKPDELLGFRPATWDDEQQIHRELAIWAVRGREWYAPAPPVVDVVNEMRRFCALPPLPYLAA